MTHNTRASEAAYEHTVAEVEGVFGDRRGEGCGPGRFDHDYSLPPHNTPDQPTAAEGRSPCQAMCHDARCEREPRYEVVVYQIGTHEWITLRACVPCTASLRRRHARLGPAGTQGIARVREVVAA